MTHDRMPDLYQMIDAVKPFLPMFAILGGAVALVLLMKAFLPAKKIPVPYEAAPLLTGPEQRFFQALREAVGDAAAIQCKVRLADQDRQVIRCPKPHALYCRGRHSARVAYR